MKIVWTPAARIALDEIYDYTVLNFGQTVAARIVTDFDSEVYKVAKFPGMGRPAVRAGVREVIVYPFLLQYKVDEKQLTVLRIRHGRRSQ